MLRGEDMDYFVNTVLFIFLPYSLAIGLGAASFCSSFPSSCFLPKFISLFYPHYHAANKRSRRGAELRSRCRETGEEKSGGTRLCKYDSIYGV
jgi:hypothetical protein